MKKNILLFLLLLSIFSYGQQTCSQVYSLVEPYANNPVLTINASDFNCYSGTPNSITITDAFLGANSDGDFDCAGGAFVYELNIDGVTSRVCAPDLIGMDITSFAILSISTDDSHYPDIDWNANLILTLTADYTGTAKPLCNAVMTTPVNGATDVVTHYQQIVFSPASGATGYHMTVGTTSGGNDLLDVNGPSTPNNVYSGYLPQMQYNTTYYVNIVPYNEFGNAVNCTEYSFTTRQVPPPGNDCANPIVIPSLPYTTTDQLDNYEQNNYLSTGCLLWFFNAASEVVYAYTAAFTGSINASVNQYAVSSSGLFIYNNCADIGTENGCAAVSTYPTLEDFNFNNHIFEINNFPVIEGQTYYFVMGSDRENSPILNDGYILTITENTCTNAKVDYYVVSDCTTLPQFLVNVDVTDMGTANSLLITDNQNSASQTAFATGIVTFGPYPNGTPVVYTIANSEDTNCVFINTEPITQANCAPSCSDAQVIVTDEVVTASFDALAGSWNYPEGEEIMYSFTPTLDDGYFLKNLGSIVSSESYSDVLIKESGAECNASGWTLKGTLLPGYQIDLGYLTAGVTYWVLLQGMHSNNDFIAHTDTFKISRPCIPATVSATLVSDCPLAEFHAQLDVAEMGSATSLTITDDLNSPAQVLTEIGTVVFGPYPNGAYPKFTIAKSDDTTCYTEAYVGTQSQCIGANDLCENAIELICDIHYYLGTTENTTLTNIEFCDEEFLNDVWFRYQGDGQNYSLRINSDSVHAEVYESTNGDCSGFTIGSCYASSFFEFLGDAPHLNFPTTTGKTYFIRIGNKNVDSAATIFSIEPLNCTTPPVNDALCNATTLIVNEHSMGNTYTNVNGTAQPNELTPSCFNSGAHSSVWFKFVAPPSGNVKVTTDIVGGGLRDTEIAVYDGTGIDCTNLSSLGEPIGCDQDGGVMVFFNSTVVLPTLIPGNTYYIQVDKYGSVANGTFGIDVIDMDNLATPSVDAQGFLVYPNPVENILNLSYNNSIEKVLVYNLLGQEVAAKSNADNTQIDMSSLASGTYLVKISSGDKVKTMKVIKN